MDSDDVSEYSEILTYVIQVTTILSTIFPLMVLASYVLLPRLRKFEFFMIVMTCTGDLIAALTLGLAVSLYQNQPGQPGEPVLQITPLQCTIQGFFEFFGSLFSFQWTANIAYSLLLSTQPVSAENKAKTQVMLSIFGFSIPLIFSIIPLIFDDYKQSSLPLSSSICFAKGGMNNFGGNIILFAFYYVPLVYTYFLKIRLIVTFNTVCIHKVRRAYRTLTRDPVILREVDHLLLYPFILIVCWIGFLSLRVMDSFVDNNAFGFQIFCYGTSNLNGFADGIAYGLYSIINYWQNRGNLNQPENDYDYLASWDARSKLNSTLGTSITKNEQSSRSEYIQQSQGLSSSHKQSQPVGSGSGTRSSQINNFKSSSKYSASSEQSKQVEVQIAQKQISQSLLQSH